MTWPSGDPNQPPYRPVPPPPPPLPYQQPYQQGYGTPPSYPYPPPKKSHKGLIIALVAVGLLVVAGVVVVGVIVFMAARNGDDRVIATDLAQGDCITDVPNSTLVSLVPKVDCAQPHSGEVYAVLTLPQGDYPGQATIDEWQNKCPGELESYSPSAMADDSVGVFVLYPTAETWAKGDRAVTCIATTDDKRTGSVKG